MGAKYTANATSGYNSSPPADDGTRVEANKVKWDTIKDKLTDPPKVRADTMDSELVTHFDNGPTLVTGEVTLGASHYNQVIEASGSSDVTLSDASGLTKGWFCDIINKGSSNFNLVRTTAADTIDGTSADIVIYPLDTIRIVVNNAADGFLTHGFLGNTQKWRKGADITAANDCVLLSDGNYNDITGATTINGFTTGSSGEIRKFHFDGAPTLKHNTEPSSGFSKLFFQSAADFVAAANNELEFIYDSASDYWRSSSTPASVSDIAYNDGTWDGNSDAATKNAIRDVIKTIGVPIEVTKTSDESVTSSSTLQDDNELTITLAADTNYRFEGLIIATKTGGAADLKWQWTEADGTYWFTVIDGAGNSGSASLSAINDATSAPTKGLAASQSNYVYCNGIIRTGVSGGVFKLQWAQTTSDATAVTVNADSYMRALPVG